MTFITGLALRRSSVTILVILLVLVAGVFTYRNLQRELFPEIEFPNITIVTVFPSADPETVEREVTKPIEEVIDGTDGLKEIQSTSSENVSLVLATFEFGEDMEDAKRDGASASVSFRFTSRQDDGKTAFESGMFKYTVTASSGAETSYRVPFEALLVKKNGKWLILMERQLEAADEAAWAALE